MQQCTMEFSFTWSEKELLSVVIPHMLNVDMDRTLKYCVRSMRGHDEIIILANDGIGYGASCNLGMKLASGDFIVVANNDCILKEGSLSDLANNQAITVPRLEPPQRDNLPRPFFCVPRWIYENVYDRYGDFYDERFEGGYWEDDDLHRRLEEMGVESIYIESVAVLHLNGGGNTMKQIGEQEHFDANKSRFEDKWSNPS